MKTEELNKRVAELCGWKQDGGIWRPKGHKEGTRLKLRLEPPSYAESYDAIMPEIFKRAARKDWSLKFSGHLITIGIHSDLHSMWSRTPAELCEAFIKTEEEMR